VSCNSVRSVTYLSTPKTFPGLSRIMAEPIGENGWLDFVDEASRTAGNIEQRIAVIEEYKRAIAAEPWSKKLWLANCEWVWSLYTDCQNGDAGWPEEEQMLGQEIFSIDTALDAWQEGYQAIKYRLDDSHELWNRWMSIELEHLANSSHRNIDRVRILFLDRLQIPHANWEATFQMFSTFVTKYDQPTAYEDTMVSARALGKTARELYDAREKHEMDLQRAGTFENGDALSFAMKEYLNWEQAQVVKRTKKGVPSSPQILCVALFERALSSTQLSIDPFIWEDYIVFLSSDASTNIPYTQLPAQVPAVLPVIQRATKHCPWSGKLWARYILRAEFEHQPFEIMEQIKHAATNTRELDRDGMDSVVEFYNAWSGYLKRMTMAAGATDEHIDVAEMGLPTALEDIQQWGKRRCGEREWKGDPGFRVERIFIQYLTQRGSFEDARNIWRRLVKTHGDGYEFWQQYYLWEMTVRVSTMPPALATAVLIQAVNRKTLDWPEKMMEVYIRHCENYEEVDTLLKALTSVHHSSKGVAKRRAREAAEAAAVYAQQQPEAQTEVVGADESSPITMKRKREVESAEPDSSLTKKVRSADQDTLREQHLKRDRENTTVLVSGLPAGVTQTKIRQYFKEYGHINNIIAKAETDGLSTVALIEFRSSEDAQSALLRDGKYFVDKQIQVVPGTGLTLYVTNFPPTTDDVYLQKLFEECGEVFSIRWPSLKHNAHRRFCYVSFRTREAASAATRLDGQSLGGVYKLVAKFSDPLHKKNREGAVAEGREIHITGLDTSLTEADLTEVFSKYGNIERVRILKNMAGQSKGSGFIAFVDKEHATAALEMDKTKLKSRVLVVEMSSGKNFKQTATVMGKAASPSPGPDANGDHDISPSQTPGVYPNTHTQNPPQRTNVPNRTITLMNVPDTVNDARIQAIAEVHGQIIKLILRPDHQGAIIEYADASSAGRASLCLENYEIAPGRKLRTGGLKDLFAEKGEIKTDRIQVGQGKKASNSLMQPPPPIRRPGAGGRGGLGQRRGLGYSVSSQALDKNTGSSADAGVTGHVATKKPKSNADFKAMFVSGGT
jgi:RNA recognition motif-containing protein